jgi:hypothetical protein
VTAELGVMVLAYVTLAGLAVWAVLVLAVWLASVLGRRR